jgi:ABC-type branched-subunit amino acid transport system substrate-binding protein
VKHLNDPPPASGARSHVHGLIAGAIAAALGACMPFDQELAAKAECTTNAQCVEKLSPAAGPAVPAVCVHDEVPRCVALTSEDCSIVTGDYMDDNAVLIASLLSTTGAQGATNIPRQQSAIMAVEEINASNASGGILQSATPGDARKLVMVSCDEAANLPRAATHLITDLHVPAIVGPNLSQDTLDLTLGDAARGLPSSAQAGTALLSPAAVASAIATIPDNGLSFMMVPSDVQRVPLMKIRINALETQLKTERSPRTTFRLGIWYRDDALGKGTADGLATLMFNGNPLAMEISKGNARSDTYNPTATATDNAAKIQTYVQFKPDIIVLIGTAEAASAFAIPFEAAWDAAQSSLPKPYYVAIDSTKVPEVLNAVNGNLEFRRRWSGTGITPTMESQPVLSAFQIAYGQRWKDSMGNPQPATQSGMGPAYDAVYTIALALVGKKAITGATISSSLAALATNAAACTSDASGIQAPCFTVSDHSRTLYANMSMLLQSKPVTEIGTFGRLEWDPQGAKSNGVIELWCIDQTGPKPIYASSGQTYDVKTQTLSATPYTQCKP